MRKWFWCCAAAGVAAAGIFGTVKYCGSHPESPMTRCVASACEIGLRGTPFSGLPGAPPGAENTLEDGIPPDPVPSADDPPASPQVIQAEPPGNRLDLPAPIVIREDDDLKEPPVAGPPSAEPGNDPPGVVAVEFDPVEPQRRMPYCDEECVPPAHMPYAEETGHPDALPHAEEGADGCGEGGCWMLRAWRALCPAECPRTACPAAAPVTPPEAADGPGKGLWRKFIDGLQGGEAGSSEEAEPMTSAGPRKDAGREDPHYPYQYPGCPYSGCPSPGPSYCPRPVPVEPKPGDEAKPGTIGKEINLLRFFRGCQEDQESRPAFPRLDTMEYRRSDQGLGDFGLGLF